MVAEVVDAEAEITRTPNTTKWRPTEPHRKDGVGEEEDTVLRSCRVTKPALLCEPSASNAEQRSGTSKDWNIVTFFINRFSDSLITTFPICDHALC